MASPSTRAPKTAPMSELIIAAPRARPASPFFAMAWPSTIVAAVVGSPGILNRIDVMSPVVAVTAEHPQEEGERLDRRHLEHERQHERQVVGPPSPGRSPTTKPRAMPISISPKVGHAKTCASPVTLAWRKSAIAGLLSAGDATHGLPARPA